MCVGRLVHGGGLDESLGRNPLVDTSATEHAYLDASRHQRCFMYIGIGMHRRRDKGHNREGTRISHMPVFHDGGKE